MTWWLSIFIFTGIYCIALSAEAPFPAVNHLLAPKSYSDERLPLLKRSTEESLFLQYESAIAIWKLKEPDPYLRIELWNSDYREKILNIQNIVEIFLTEQFPGQLQEQLRSVNLIHGALIGDPAKTEEDIDLIILKKRDRFIEHLRPERLQSEEKNEQNLRFSVIYKGVVFRLHVMFCGEESITHPENIYENEMLAEMIPSLCLFGEDVVPERKKTSVKERISVIHLRLDTLLYLFTDDRNHPFYQQKIRRNVEDILAEVNLINPQMIDEIKKIMESLKDDDKGTNRQQASYNIRRKVYEFLERLEASVPSGVISLQNSNSFQKSA